MTICCINTAKKRCTLQSKNKLKSNDEDLIQPKGTKKENANYDKGIRDMHDRDIFLNQK